MSFAYQSAHYTLSYELSAYVNAFAKLFGYRDGLYFTHALVKSALSEFGDLDVLIYSSEVFVRDRSSGSILLRVELGHPCTAVVLNHALTYGYVERLLKRMGEVTAALALAVLSSDEVEIDSRIVERATEALKELEQHPPTAIDEELFDLVLKLLRYPKHAVYRVRNGAVYDRLEDLETKYARSARARLRPDGYYIPPMLTARFEHGDYLVEAYFRPGLLHLRIENRSGKGRCLVNVYPKPESLVLHYFGHDELEDLEAHVYAWENIRNILKKAVEELEKNVGGDAMAGEAVRIWRKLVDSMELEKAYH